jgi:hypothetical protein
VRHIGKLSCDKVLQSSRKLAACASPAVAAVAAGVAAVVTVSTSTPT